MTPRPIDTNTIKADYDPSKATHLYRDPSKATHLYRDDADKARIALNNLVWKSCPTIYFDAIMAGVRLYGALRLAEGYSLGLADGQDLMEEAADEDRATREAADPEDV